MSNNIDMQKLHLAPKPVQMMVALGLAAIILGAGYFFKYQEQWEEIKAAEEKEVQLKEEFTTNAAKAANLENLQLELTQIEESIQYLVKQLPTGPEIPNLIQEMHGAAANNGLTMNTVTPQPSVKDDTIERLPFQIAVTGNYEQLAQFMRSLGRMSRIVTLSGVTVTPVSQDKGKNSKLTLSAIANTYKAVDTALPASSASAASGAATPAQ